MTEYYDEYQPYVSVAKRKANSEKLIAKLRKKGQKISPITVKSRGKIAQSFWGQSWCKHLNTYQDMDYRLDRGRSYLRHSAVVDLGIIQQEVQAKVNGSELYDISIKFQALSDELWNNMISECSGEIDSVLDLLQGKLPDKVSQAITDPETGLFPQAEEINFDCNCMDYADCCKHVAACLYGIGVRFDEEPMLFFVLRGRDPQELIAEASKSLNSTDTTQDQDMENLFGIEIGDLSDIPDI